MGRLNHVWTDYLACCANLKNKRKQTPPQNQNNLEGLLSMLAAKGGLKMIFLRYFMRLVTSQIGTKIKQRHLMRSSPLPLTQVMALGPLEP